MVKRNTDGSLFVGEVVESEIKAFEKLQEELKALEAPVKEPVNNPTTETKRKKGGRPKRK